MSLATAGIYCTTSLPLSPAMEASSIVQVQQLQSSIVGVHITTYNAVRHVVERIVVTREHSKKTAVVG